MNFRQMVKNLIPTALFREVEPYGHWLEAIIENVVFGFPARSLKVIGVTGTAGKTTTCMMITHMMRESGLKVAMLTTISIDYGDGNGAHPNSTRLTSLGSLKMLKEIKKIKAAGAQWLVLETTSHALAQHRVWGVPYSVAVFTNLSHDNADYHGNFENYRAAKLKMFGQCNRNHRGLRVGVINSDDPSGELFAGAISNPLRYGIKNGDLRAVDINLTATGSSYTAKIQDDHYKIHCNLPGEFNLYNSLAVVGVGRSIGLAAEQIERGIASIQSVEGRMNRVDEGQDFEVIVDYACTPDSFTKVFEAVKPLAKRRIIAVFGSAGRRDELKRPIQGEIAGRIADMIILTEEDDRDQDGAKIMDEIATGAKKAGKVSGNDLLLIHEREAAVKKAIELAQPGDMVLLLGKGEEKTIITNKPGVAPVVGRPFNEATDTLRRAYSETAVARSAIRAKAQG